MLANQAGLSVSASLASKASRYNDTGRSAWVVSVSKSGE